jgi:hypothetical protein
MSCMPFKDGYTLVYWGHGCVTSGYCAHHSAGSTRGSRVARPPGKPTDETEVQRASPGAMARPGERN